MPQLDDEARPALLDERQAVKNQRATWAALAGAMAYGTTYVPPVFIIPAALCTLMGVVTSRQINALERALDDPPRDDYLVPTRKGFRHFDPTPLGDSPLARHTADAAREILEVSALLDAAVRAEERALGAQLANHPTAEERRSAEAQRLMQRALHHHDALANAMVPLAAQWKLWGDDVPPLPPPAIESDEREVTVDLLAGLPGESVQVLRETGLSTEGTETRIAVPADQFREPLPGNAARIPVQSIDLAAKASRVAGLPKSATRPVRLANSEVRVIEDFPQIPPPVVRPGRLTIFERVDGGYSFRLSSADGQIFAASVRYETRSAARRAAKLFIENAPTAEIVVFEG